MEGLPLCKCGCGERVAKKGNKFIWGHNNRRKDYHEQQICKPCKCGCGELANPERDYIAGHQTIGRERSLKERNKISETKKANKSKPEALLCECGCGELAKPGNRFIAGHHPRGKAYWKMVQGSQLCKCGCGELAEPGNDYINGHQMSGVNNGMYGETHSPEIRVKMSIAIGDKCSGEKNGNWQGGISFEPYCDKFTFELKQQIRNQYDNCDYFSGLPTEICNIVNGKCQKLCVHHIDRNKMQGCNGIKWHLIPLSRKNHSYIHANQSFWERLICYALEYDKTYYNIKQINIKEIIEWKQTTGVISNTF